MKLQILPILLCCVLSLHAAEPKSVLLVAGKPSHGAGEHEHHAGCKLLAKALDESGLNLRTGIHFDTWPGSGAFDGIDALVLYGDGNKDHLALGHEAELQALSDRGTGIVFLHYAVDGKPGLLNETLLNCIGGYYDDDQSKNPEWLVKDEVYYNIRLGAVTPVLSAIPPEEGGALHTLAWVYGAPGGARGFGFTGAHYHKTCTKLRRRPARK